MFEKTFQEIIERFGRGDISPTAAMADLGDLLQKWPDRMTGPLTMQLGVFLEDASTLQQWKDKSTFADNPVNPTHVGSFTG